jgi:hypothetical protein
MRDVLSMAPSASRVVVATDDFEWAPALEVIYLLKRKGELAAASTLTTQLMPHANDQGDASIIGNVLRLLAGDREAAIMGFAQAFREKHYHSWWIRQRDPMLDEIRDDPRYRAAFQIELDRVAEQRSLLETMRAKGDVPQRHRKAAAGHA